MILVIGPRPADRLLFALPLYAYVRRKGFSPEDAEDLAQEFLNACNRCSKGGTDPSAMPSSVGNWD